MDQLESWVRMAQNGKKESLENVIGAIKDDVFHLCLRTLSDPEQALETSQEILIKVIVKLSTFKFESQFKTWVYRVSMNYLIDYMRTRPAPQMTFDSFKQDLESDLTEPTNYANKPEYKLLLDQVRIGCTIAMLQCLDFKHRVVYILGEIFELDSKQACYALEMSPENYRQMLSRSRKKVLDFTKNACGIVNPKNPCSCPLKLTGSVKRGHINANEHSSISNESADAYDRAISYINRIDETKMSLRNQRAQQNINFKSPVFDILELIDKIEEP